MLLEVNNITKFYPGQNEPVLDGITFAVDKGERVGIVGESGSGKTTLSRIIAGLEPADDGSIAFNGASMDFRRASADPKQAGSRGVAGDADGVPKPCGLLFRSHGHRQSDMGRSGLQRGPLSLR